ncbi:fibronectin type III domain-containing protein [Salinibacterium sp. UTAS2018]|uniref:Ig-like domain-containing protein n=1 Tax=Salinibacterium sp. UTAS2018 TaxID=2508880 RepID=UPI0010096E66|nr:Ig-like domain-containing protein [Salinibacterium sp. UTAS2018]QAV69890.1 fibronectin type III domain-containing protein [Salinibacterium sp. UTAS2018]
MKLSVSRMPNRKTIASVVTLSLVVGVPLTVAALHPGYPVSDVDLVASDVWVTNGEQLLGGRLNRQIDELNGSVIASSARFDVLQDGDALFMVDPVAHRVESVDPATTEVTSAIDLPPEADVSFGGTNLAIVSPQGDLWIVPSVGDLQFNYISTPPVLELGVGGRAAVTANGVVIAVSSEKKSVYRVATIADEPVRSDFPAVGEFQIAAAGESAVVFDQSTNELVTESGSIYPLAKQGLRLQQSSTESEFAVVATADSLQWIDLGNGETTDIDADMSTPAADLSGVSAPIALDGCAHGAWASAQRYVLACPDGDVQTHAISEPTQGSELEFRVNGSVIALNNLSNGNVWLLDDNMRLVENWDDVTPPEDVESEEEGDEKSSIQSFEDTLAERTETNRAPVAVDDEYGVRPGRTTVFTVLENDTDADGDVLVISGYDRVAESTGRLDLIDGGRALQFTPVPEFVGSIAFSYTIDDGREGVAQARVTATVVPEGRNELPFSVREAGVSVEANQTVSYNVLADWKDPDGDDLSLVAASPKSGDLVRFTPDGFITFTHQTSELGEKEITFLVSDGSNTPVPGELIVTVEPPGTLNPVGTPDFATAFATETVVIEPLLNDLSPSGKALSLIALDEAENGAVASFDSDRGEITFSSASAGIFYLTYTLSAGANTSVGLVRIDVQPTPDSSDLPPVAVKDTAYLRGDEPTTVSVLSNDVSPSGNVLAIQSIDVDPALTDKGLVVELLESTLIRVTSPAALTKQVNFTYTISDGVGTATAGVTVVPVPALTKHQPPVALDDAAKVRAGDVITLDVLDNDFHPDDSSMSLDPELVSDPSDGVAFVSRDALRFQAPTTPGLYTVDYRVVDPFGETAAATASFTVTPVDADSNQDPTPTTLVARVLAGGELRIEIPLSTVDPDGDSTTLLGFPTNPTLGSVKEFGTDYFIYESSPAAAGTDTFSYEVVDAFGATGVAEVKIAVIPEPDELRDPIAVPDSVAIRPGRTAQIDLSENDSDPQGAPISVEAELIDVPDGVSAEVIGHKFLLLTAPDEEQSFSIRYTLTNDRGGSAVSYVLVKVTKDAPILPPSADDVSIVKKDIAGKQSITIDLFDGYAFNPAGKTDDLVVALEGANADAGVLAEINGQIVVTPGATRKAITYSVTNELDDLSARAFILVPAAVDENFDEPPVIDPNLPVQYVAMNETRQWKLSDIVLAPSGRDVWIPNEGTVSAVQGNGEPNYVDKDTITFTPAKDYRGPASVNFTVTDGASKNDPAGIEAGLRLNIVVGDPDFKDTPPEFTSPSPQVEVGETTTIDLRDSTAHPNNSILNEVKYSDLTGATDGLDASLSGSELSLNIPRTTPKGTKITLGVMLRWDKFEVPGTINVTVVGSTRPLAVAVSDVVESQRGDGTITVNPLTNDSNPYLTTGEALTVIDAQVQNTGEPADVTFTADSISILPDAALKSGQIEVVYTIADATEDADRHVNGTVTLIVSDVPDGAQKPTRDEGSAVGGDKSATWRFVAPATNGKPIVSYEVRTTPAVATLPTNCEAGAACTVTGLQNGTPYTFGVRAINEHGPGEWSPTSDQITPYGTPAAPVVTASVQSQWAPNGRVSASWPAVGGTGGTTTYHWASSNGDSGETTGTSATTTANLAAGNYTFTVYAENSGGKRGSEGTSNSAQVQNQTVPGRVTGITGAVTKATTPGSIKWTWAAAPGGAAVTDNLIYTWTLSNGATGTTTGTSVTNTGLPAAGSYTLTVVARNNAGAGAAGTGTSGAIVTPATVSFCFYFNGESPGVHNFGFNWSGQSNGNHTLQIGDQNGSFSSSYSGRWADGHQRTSAWKVWNRTPGNADGRFVVWPIFDGVRGANVAVQDIPAC